MNGSYTVVMIKYIYFILFLISLVLIFLWGDLGNDDETRQ